MLNTYKLSKSKNRISKRVYTNQYSKRQALNNLYRNELKSKPTKAELVFKSFLEKEKIRFDFQKGFLKPYHRIVDFYLPKHKMIIEIDGGYHLKDSVFTVDTLKDSRWLFERGMKTIRITNDEVFNGEFIKKIEELC